MPLETVNYLNDLNPALPDGEDDRSQGDDHVRNVKKALKATFPGLSGRAWRTVNRSQSYALSETDNMTTQRCAAGITVTCPAASTLGNGFTTLIRADGNGSVTISGPVNDGDSFVVPNNYTAMLVCDGSEYIALLMFHNIPSPTPAFPAGTRMVFHQTAAPTGWTKLTNTQYNNAAMRMTTGVVGTGGVDDFTTVFSASRSTAGHALTVAQLPPHTHGGGRDTQAAGLGPGWGGDAHPGLSNRVATDSTGSGSTHSHTISNMNIKFVDLIVAEAN